MGEYLRSGMQGSSYPSYAWPQAAEAARPAVALGHAHRWVVAGRERSLDGRSHHVSHPLGRTPFRPTPGRLTHGPVEIRQRRPVVLRAEGTLMQDARVLLRRLIKAATGLALGIIVLPFVVILLGLGTSQTVLALPKPTAAPRAGDGAPAALPVGGRTNKRTEGGGPAIPRAPLALAGTVSVADFEQCENGKPPSAATNCPDGWTNGSLNAQNSHYAEDQVVPQRLVLSLSAGGTTTGRTVTL